VRIIFLVILFFNCRAAVLGATDGAVSTGGLLLGVSGASTDHRVLLLSGVAGLVAGALSMAVGEYISVASQRDMEESDISKERKALSGPEFQCEYEELVQIYVNRGLEQGVLHQAYHKVHNHISPLRPNPWLLLHGFRGNIVC
jgi:VIT1/CCC1 family predicted Fe2+/Mn2+ transporter